MDDIEVWRQMYATLCIAVDSALTQLENLHFQEAMETLQSALNRAEDLFFDAELAVTELSQYKNEKS